MKSPDENLQRKPRTEFLALAESCGARITGKPDGSEPIEVVFTIEAWRSFDRAMQLGPSDALEVKFTVDAKLASDMASNVAVLAKVLRDIVIASGVELPDDISDELPAGPDLLALGNEVVTALRSCNQRCVCLPTEEQLAEALSDVGCFHEMSAELIAPTLRENLVQLVGGDQATELALLREYRLSGIAFNDAQGEGYTVEQSNLAEQRMEAAEKACWDFYAGRKLAPSAPAGEAVPAGGVGVATFRLECKACNESSTLDERKDMGGCCWACGHEIDLDPYLRAAMASLPVGVPDGYAMVPVEPSFETRQALYNSGFEAPDNILDYGYRSILGAVKIPVEAYRADTRKPHELSAAGCRCVRFGEGNPHWPCELHAAKKEQADLVAVWRCRVAGGESYAYFPSKRCRFCEPLYAAPTVKAGHWKCEQCGASTGESCNTNGCFANERSADQALSLPAAGSAVEKVEVVGYATPGQLELRNLFKQYPGMRIKKQRDVRYSEPLMTVAQHERIVATQQSSQPELTVWEGQMPESNGKSNFTAVLMRKGAGLFDGIAGGMTIARSEYPDRVRYEADCVRWLIGELDEQPCIIDYDADKHSGYVAQHSAPERVSVPVELLERLVNPEAWLQDLRKSQSELRALLSRNGNGGGV